MERIENILHFKSSEKSRFLRAITLVWKLFGYSKEDAQVTVEHERAHIEKAEELGCIYGLEGYRIKVKKCCRYFGLRKGSYEITAGVRRNSDLPSRKWVEISMAPKIPSPEDFMIALTYLLDYERDRKRLKQILEEGGDFPEFKSYLLERASSL